MGFSCIKRKLYFTNKLSPRLKDIKKDLKKNIHHPITVKDLNKDEQNIINRIKSETAQKNKNNTTRTHYYLEFYKQFPEIHWAFLGHMVSRNGGWNMTDLRGGLLSRLLSEEEQNNFFAFLERGNWLIFHDIYPQLLLYQESVNRNTNLFYMLQVIGASTFMEVIWNYFWENKDEYLLAIALVINEQSYLEERVIQKPYYQKTVLETIEFKLQDLLSLNQILFPYIDESAIRLTGQTIHHFSSLHDRILLGKRLYKLLFERENYHKFFKWASKQPHTGSRKDYCSMLFNDINESIPGKPFKRRTENCNLKPGSHRIYSPKLKYAWKNREHEQAEKGDWYHKWKVVHYLEKYTQHVDGDILDEYCDTLERIEFAILAKEKFLYKNI
ncbi:DUF2515 family protein [Virgibacillus ndiopensis]|uniref:DUF2515 family protein n=1 Tax=Virgibacillus ndiopensis TaxID=2004408 RepID=UPI00159BB685|nr:DUF2515 family protein [Virgibacillus ndiopensis]